MKRVLITGFDPFGGEQVNPSWEAVSRLPEQVGEHVLCKLQIPTVFGEAAQRILEKAETFQPDVIISVGLAGGRQAVTPERIGVNIRDARIPDNAGHQPVGEFVVKEGPAAYFSTLPVLDMVKAMEKRGIPAAVSNSAGAFVCNDVLYTLLHHYAGTSVRVGFVHVPRVPEQGEPSLPLDKTVEALGAAIEIL